MVKTQLRDAGAPGPTGWGGGHSTFPTPAWEAGGQTPRGQTQSWFSREAQGPVGSRELGFKLHISVVTVLLKRKAARFHH